MHRVGNQIQIGNQSQILVFRIFCDSCENVCMSFVHNISLVTQTYPLEGGI